MELRLNRHIEIQADFATLAEIERNCTYQNPKFDEALR